MNKIKVFIISSSAEKTDKIKNLLKKAPDISVEGVCGMGPESPEKIEASSPGVALLIADEKDNIIGTVQRLYLNLPTCSQILIHENSEMEMLQQAVKAGVRNLLNWPVDGAELQDNIRYLYNVESARKNMNSAPAAGGRQSQVITVFGTKGGIGKTTVAVNLATTLARVGKKTAIVDLDLQFGDVGVFLDIDTKDSIAELVAENDFDIDRIKSYLQLHQSGLHVLCAPKSPEYAETVNSSHIEKIINGLRPFYDYIIIDTPPAFNDNTLTALELSNQIYFILTLDISTLRNAKISMGVMESLEHGGKIKIIVNREAESVISVKDAEKVVKSPVYCRIPSDWKTATASLNKGVPFVLDSPNAKISAALYKLASLTCGGFFRNKR